MDVVLVGVRHRTAGLCLNGTSETVLPEWSWLGTPCVGLAVDDVPGAVAKCRRRGVKILIPPVETSV